MNGIKYLIDTNCFVYLLDEHPCVSPFIDDGWAFSYITEMELLSKRDLSEKDDQLIREVLDTCYKINHFQSITDIVIGLRRKYRIKLPDAIIAATAKLLQLPLITADDDFAKIVEIDCIILDYK